MLGLLKIDEQCSCRCNAKREAVDRKTLERVNAELPLEPFHRTLIYERPFLKCRNIVMVSVLLLRSLFKSSRNKKFLRSKRTQKSSNVIKRTFRHLESTGRYVKKCRSALVLMESETGNIVMLLLFEELL